MSVYSTPLRLFSVLLFLAAGVGRLPASASRQCVTPKEEMQVLASYLKWSADKKSITVLQSMTDSGAVDIDKANLMMAVRGHGTPPDVRSDFKAKQTQECRIPPIKGITNLRLLSKAEHDRLFRARDGWSRFHSRFGHEASLVTLSRVGFNVERTKALLYVTRRVANISGNGFIYLFALRDGRWVEEAESLVWET